MFPGLPDCTMYSHAAATGKPTGFVVKFNDNGDQTVLALIPQPQSGMGEVRLYLTYKKTYPTRTLPYAYA